MKRVLITGGGGFIGRHCLPQLLSRDYEIHVVDRQIGEELGSRVTFHRLDLLQGRETLELVMAVKPTHLLHLAWVPVSQNYWTAPDNLRWVQASLELVETFCRAGGQRLVMAGTCAEYDWRYGYCSEALTPLAPATLYGVSKHALRLLVEAFALQAGLSAAWGRVFFIYGPHEPPTRLVASVIRALLHGKPARCSHGRQLRDFLHVQDVAGAFVTLLDSQVTGPCNLASGQPVAVKEVVSTLAAALGREDLVEFGALPLAANEPALLVGDNKRLTEELGWAPQWDLASGLKATVDWWRGEVIRETHGRRA